MEDLTRKRRIDALFAEALDLEPGARAAHLAQACAGDSQLHAAVMRLLEIRSVCGSVDSPPSTRRPTS
jgi:hypothetical protein